MKIFDAIIIAVVFAAGLAGVAAFSKAPAGRYVEIRSPEGVSRYPLDTDRVIDLRGKLGPYRFVIEDGSVRAVESDCPYRICIYRGAIHLEGDSIICVPNGVSARIVGDGGGLDAIAE